MTAEDLARACEAAVRVPVRSVLLHGSLATGDFVPGVSDVDLLAVVDETLSPPEVDALVAVVSDADPAPAAGIDLHVLTAAAAATPSPAPARELLVSRHPGAAIEVETAVAGDADLPAELSMARAGGRALIGAAPSAVLGAVDPAWLHERGVFWLRRWLTLTDDVRQEGFMVSTACRMWHFRVEGTHASKTAAMTWALERDDSLVAVRAAREHRRTGSGVRLAERDVRAVLDAALAAVGRPASRTG